MMNTATMPTHVEQDQQSLLRRSLLVDGIVSGTTGVLLAVAAGPVADQLGLPELLLRLSGVSFLPYAAALFYLATRPTVPRGAAWAVIGLNLLWAVASIALLLTGWVDPTTLGVVFTIGQALIVAGFADVQYLALRRLAA
jgi:hypothetical protein